MKAISAGSSPLARGLRIEHVADPSSRRIIPARAGFTAAPRPGGVPRRDHPRSRGVYRMVMASSRIVSGSSPLARGLLGGLVGIVANLMDHPRSRGVYHAMVLGDIKPDGSSPLARGLLPRRREHEQHARIIPARAGFTSSSSRTSPATADHPRSRGVYNWRDKSPAVRRGSSPLARGLPRECPTSHGRGWIIPARAGFTSSWRRPARPSADHPRSRGVYSGVGAARFPEGRIIPARAGFTQEGLP